MFYIVLLIYLGKYLLILYFVLFIFFYSEINNTGMAIMALPDRNLSKHMN